MADGQDSHSDDTASKKGGKARRELPAGAVATLKAWLLSPEHFTHPYPTPQDQIMLMQKTGIDKKQLKNWFTNARRRIWKPMLKKQLEQGKIQQTGNGGVVTLSATPGLMNIADAAADYSVGGSMGDPNQLMQQTYQQSSQQQQQQQQQQYDLYGNNAFLQQPQSQQQSSQYGNANYFSQVQGQYNQNDTIGTSTSIGSLPPMGVSNSTTHLNKTDSHAVLMELFTRDQDLVRRQKEIAALQATQSGVASNPQSQVGSQHPMSNKISGGSSTLNKLGNVPSMNSWPHFSSVSSLNNLGTMTGVKSITNMSGADLVSQGSLNKKGNLAQVKSIENMGRADSYAFLEVFFENPGGGTTQSQRGVKRDREEDDNVGLSLDGDEGSSPMATMQGTSMESMKSSSAPVPAPIPLDGQDREGLKRAYDDALAARGLISVSRSSEKLTDLALPVKMQRTISQEYLKSMNSGNSTTFTTFSFNSNIPQQQASSGPSPELDNMNDAAGGVTQQSKQQLSHNSQHSYTDNLTDDKFNDSVEVPFSTKCALCQQTKVDTQLRPCGHLFHGNCVKNSIQNAIGAPRCPIDNITMVSAILAVPTADNANSNTAYNGNNPQGKH